MYQDVKDFYVKFSVPAATEPSLLSNQLFLDRVRFMHEELDELVNSHDRGDLPQAIDGLVDLAYVVLGTAYFMGIDFQQHWNLVHEANLQKVPCLPGESKRNMKYDMRKPQGWVSPDHSTIVGQGPWMTFSHD